MNSLGQLYQVSYPEQGGQINCTVELLETYTATARRIVPYLRIRITSATRIISDRTDTVESILTKLAAIDALPAAIIKFAERDDHGN